MQKIKFRKGTATKGFSLIEVLIAIAILVVITVPLAYNMISTSQINTKSKNTSVASDLSATMIESMHAIKLSDLMIEMNGYDANEFGEKLAYSLKRGSLQGFDVSSTFEAIKETNDGISYRPVTKNEDPEMIIDAMVESSIKTRYTDNDGVLKAYFTGNKDDKYSVVLKDVHNDEASFDIVLDIEKGQEYSLANIKSMDSSTVVNMYEKQTSNTTAAEHFAQLNIQARAADQSVVSHDVDYFLSTFTKEYVVNIKQDTITEATNIIVTCTYTVPDGSVGNFSETYTITIGSFSTNSTAEFASGVYVYFYPTISVGEERDFFVVNNKNELSTVVYLIAVGSDASDPDFLNKYYPSITVNELSDIIYADDARTTVCSNIPNDTWVSKTITPAKKNGLTIKSLANISDTQTLYNVNVKIYAHNKNSFTTEGIFQPNEKNLLIETSGSFLDNSIKYDIDSDKTTGLTPVGEKASATPIDVTYNGELQQGLIGTNVTFSGIYEAVDAGEYLAYAQPNAGCTWADGTNTKRPFRWTLKRCPEATASASNKQYTSEIQEGVTGQYVTWVGRTSGKDVGSYTAYATPEPNYAWEDGTTNVRPVEWKILTREVTLVWETGPDLDTWYYDGLSHTAQCHVQGLLVGDTCEAILKDATIKDIGKKTARVVGLSNTNYVLPTLGRTHEIQVIPQNGAYVNIQESYVYDGLEKQGVTSSSGVVLTGTTKAIAAGNYEITATLQPGFTWADGDANVQKKFSWRITSKETIAVWGTTTTWEYDGKAHSTTCVIKDRNGVTLTDVVPTLTGNSITNAGSTTVTITKLSNPNYTLPSNNTIELTVTPKPVARYTKQDYTYDGLSHFGVTDYYKVNITGAMSQTEAGSYTTFAAPMANYSWEDDPTNTDPRVIVWHIDPIRDAYAVGSQLNYTGETIRGVYGANIVWDQVRSVLRASEIAEYTAYATPLPNHAWEDDGTTGERTIHWAITAKPTSQVSLVASPSDSIALSDDDDYIENVLMPFYYNSQEQHPYFATIMQTISATTPADDPIWNALGWHILNDATHVSTTSAVNVGTYHIYLQLDENATWSDGSTDIVDLQWEIAQRPVVLSWTAVNEDYNGQDVDLRIRNTHISLTPAPAISGESALAVNDTKPTYTIKYYAADKTTLLSSAPKNAGTYYYTVTLTVKNNRNQDVTSNYLIAYSGKQTITINKIDILDSWIVAPVGSYGLIYTGSPQNLIDPNHAGGWNTTPIGDTSRITYEYALVGQGGSWSASLPTGTNAKTYQVTWRIVDGNGNYNTYWNSEADSIYVTIAKADQTVTAPTTKTTLSYTGSAQSLLNAAATTNSGLTIWYRAYNIGTSSWVGDWKNTYSAVTATNAGTYRVYYKVEGNGNWNVYGVTGSDSINDPNSLSKYVTVTISKASPAVAISTLSRNNPHDDVHVCQVGTVNIGITTSNLEATSCTLSGAKTGTVNLSGTNDKSGSTSFTSTSTGSKTITVSVAATTNYNSCSKSVTITVDNHNNDGAYKTTGGSQATAATCTAASTNYHKCCQCGTQLSSTYISGSALGHSPETTNSRSFIRTNAATCRQNYTYYKKCTRCNQSCGESYGYWTGGPGPHQLEVESSHWQTTPTYGGAYQTRQYDIMTHVHDTNGCIYCASVVQDGSSYDCSVVGNKDAENPQHTVTCSNCSETSTSACYNHGYPRMIQNKLECSLSGCRNTSERMMMIQ